MKDYQKREEGIVRESEINNKIGTDKKKTSVFFLIFCKFRL
jgi:hypothetical protein